MSQHSLFIDGQWHSGTAPQLTSSNPANGDVIWQGNTASTEQVDQAISAARKAFTSWSITPLTQRQQFIEDYTDLIKRDQEKLAQLISNETGKPFWEAKTEVAAMIGKAGSSIQAQQERAGTTYQTLPFGQQVLRHRPHGVVAIFGPFNFPGHLPNGHIIPALLAGNTVVFKPSEQTPAVAAYMVKLWQETGLPDGVLNLLQGQKETAVAIADHPQLDGLFFTGSSETGRNIHKSFSGHPEKILALEMGGNNPLVIEQVSNIDAAAYEIIQSAFITSGQRCTCARRLLLPESDQGDQILARLLELTSKISVGDPQADPPPFMGSLISSAAADQLLQAQQSLIDNGAQALLKMEKIKPDTGIVTPGILEVSQVKNLPDKEYFGPLLQVIRYQNFDQAIEIANQTRFGLSAGLFSDDPQKFEHFLLKIRAGIVNFNRQTTGASGAAPFGGVGVSGNHHPSAYYAADYCAYPVASIESEGLELPAQLSPGLSI